MKEACVIGDFDLDRYLDGTLGAPKPAPPVVPTCTARVTDYYTETTTCGKPAVVADRCFWCRQYELRDLYPQLAKLQVVAARIEELDGDEALAIMALRRGFVR